MSEELISTIRVMRTGFPAVYEDLFLTNDKVIVARTGSGLTNILSPIATGVLVNKNDKKLRKLSIEDILKANKNNYIISNSEINEVELKKKLGSIKIKIDAKVKKIEWFAMGISIKEEGKEKEVLKGKIEDYENILRPIFGTKFKTK